MFSVFVKEANNKSTVTTNIGCNQRWGLPSFPEAKGHRRIQKTLLRPELGQEVEPPGPHRHVWKVSFYYFNTEQVTAEEENVLRIRNTG